MKTGPNIVNDGLVFGYDTGEFSSDSSAFETFKPFSGNNRFYKGRNARNHIAFQNAVRKFPLEAANYSSAGTFAQKHPNDIKAYDINGNRLQTYVNTGVTDWTNTHHAHWQHDPILNKPVVVMEDLVSGQWKAKSFGTGLGSWNSLGLTHGDKYTISWLQWVDNLSKNAKAGLYTKNSAGSNGFHDGQANSASSYNTKLRTWQRVYQTYTTNSNRDLSQTLASIYMYGQYDVRATVKVADVQIDLHDHPTAYQEYNGSTTERSSTEGLLDLKGNTTINTSTVSFDSNGFPTFDGTDDEINIPSADWNKLSLVTVEVIVLIHGTPIDNNAYHVVVQKNGGYSGAAVYGIRISNSNVPFASFSKDGTTTGQNQSSVYGNAMTANKYYHLVYTRKVGESVFYQNGVEVSKKTDNNESIYNNTNSITVGQGDGRQLYGKVPVVKIHNKVLSADEVKQNFDAYKNRFEL